MVIYLEVAFIIRNHWRPPAIDESKEHYITERWRLLHEELEEWKVFRTGIDQELLFFVVTSHYFTF